MLQFGQLRHEIDRLINTSDSLGSQIESKRALAIAYANLLSEDPRMVTTGHLHLLGKEFTPEQVCVLTKYILSLSGKRSKIFKRTFDEVFGACKSSASSPVTTI